MKRLITLVSILFALGCISTYARDDKAKNVVKKKTRAKPVKIVEVDQQVSKPVRAAILTTNANLVKLAAKQVKVNGNSGKANAVVVYHSHLVDTTLALHINVRYENSKDYYYEKTPSKKYIITINGDQSNFTIFYTSHNKKFNLKYRYPDYAVARKATKAEMEKEVMNALSAINKKGRQKTLIFQNY